MPAQLLTKEELEGISQLYNSTASYKDFKKEAKKKVRVSKILARTKGNNVIKKLKGRG